MKYIFSHIMGVWPKFSWKYDANYRYFYVKKSTYDRCLSYCAHNSFDKTYKKEICTGVIYNFQIDYPEDIYEAERCIVFINFAPDDHVVVSSGMPDLPYNRLTTCQG